jgi:hypothetical protein
MDSTRIVSLQAENFKKLTLIDVKFDERGAMVIGSKRNGAGKSSVLDGITATLMGKKALPVHPVRKGESKAKTVVELSNGLIVTRTYTESGGGSLKVTNKEGFVMTSPQAMLDGLFSAIGFDPLEFSRMDTKKRTETLKKMVGLNFDELDQMRQEIYADRATVNRVLREVEAKIESATYHEDAPEQEISVELLMRQIDEAQDFNRALDKERETLALYTRRVMARRDQVAELEKQLQEAKEDLIAEKQQMAAQSEKVNALPEPKDISAIRDQIAQSAQLNKALRDNQELEKSKRVAEKLRTDSDGFTERIKDIDLQKVKALQEAKFPIDGLSFDDNGVTYNGTPFEDLCSAEQIKVSTAMGFAMNPKLKVLIVRDGSLLDQESLQAIHDLAVKEDGLILVERVSDGSEVAILIEDGTVVQREAEADTAAA